MLVYITRTVDIQYHSNNLVHLHRDSFTGDAWKSYSQDARGNATDNGPINFAYDWANQPTSMSGSDSGAFTYDGNYKRVKQVINGSTAYSVYDLDGVLVWREINGWPVSELSVGGQSARIGGIAPNIHKDLLGSPVAATDFNGVAWREDYTPFGESRLNPTGNADSHNFTGHIRDNDTGLVYMQARYYDPIIGRFLSTDPVGFAEGGPAYFNRYAYAFNDPVNNIDPTGEIPLPVVGFVIGIVADSAGQFGQNGGSFKNFDRGQALRAGAIGAVGGGFSSLGKSLVTQAANAGVKSSVVRAVSAGRNTTIGGTAAIAEAANAGVEPEDILGTAAIDLITGKVGGAVMSEIEGGDDVVREVGEVLTNSAGDVVRSAAGNDRRRSSGPLEVTVTEGRGRGDLDTKCSTDISGPSC